MLKKIAATLIIATLAIAGCDGESGPDTPRSEPPAELAGDWFTGTLSSIQYYDRDTGEWQNPSGEGFYFIFDDDGSYETGAIIDSTIGGCNMRLLGNETGTLTVDGDEMTLYRHRITVKVTNSCGNSGERTQGESIRKVTWGIEEDENGLAWLVLTGDDGSVERYRRWKQ